MTCQILVVDDEREIAELLAEMLGSDGHDVEIAENGSHALEKLRAQPFDLVFSDMRMPELDGPGLYRAVERAYPALARRFVFITGDAFAGEVQEIAATTLPPSVGKPFRWAEIRSVVARVVESAWPAP